MAIPLGVAGASRSEHGARLRRSQAHIKPDASARVPPAAHDNKPGRKIVAEVTEHASQLSSKPWHVLRFRAHVHLLCTVVISLMTECCHELNRPASQHIHALASQHSQWGPALLHRALLQLRYRLYVMPAMQCVASPFAQQFACTIYQCTACHDAGCNSVGTGGLQVDAFALRTLL